jgi:ribonuclease P protein component
MRRAGGAASSPSPAPCLMAGPERLRRGADIRATLRNRAAAHGDTSVVHARMRGDGGAGRVAVVAGRKVGNAVARNRAKRRLRAALVSMSVPRGVDVVVVARPGAVGWEFAGLRAELGHLTETAVERAEAARTGATR